MICKIINYKRYFFKLNKLLYVYVCVLTMNLKVMISIYLIDLLLNDLK